MMRHSEYATTTGSTPREKRQAVSDVRLVSRLEGYVGPLNLSKRVWSKLVPRLRRYTRHDWRSVRDHGVAAVAEIKKKGQSKASTTE